MKPLIVLVVTFGFTLAASAIFCQNVNLALSGKVAIAAMLLFTTIGHFAFKKGMEMMIPKFFPYKSFIVFSTGIFEILAAICLFIKQIEHLTAFMLILFFILILPANIYASMKNVDYQKGTFDGKGLVYLWFRIPLQFFYIAWIYYFILKLK